ncbi:MAG: glycogen-binding domain-containing protein [Candidatus Acetothermia bacterium]
MSEEENWGTDPLEEQISEEWEKLIEEQSAELEGLEDQVQQAISSRRLATPSRLNLLKNRVTRFYKSFTPIQRLSVGGALVTAVIIGLMLGWFLPTGTSDGGREVVFRFQDERARSVSVAGDFTGFEPQEMQDKDGDGVWTLRMELDEGKYEYYYLVDGDKKADTYTQADEIVRDWDNSKNGIIYIGPKDETSDDNKTKRA